MASVVVVGGSLAGLRACEALRSAGFAGALSLVSAEVHLPYDRPPLSKKLLAGDWEPDRIALRTAEQIGTLELDMRAGSCATALDIAGRRVMVGDDSLAFDQAIIATGAAPRRLPGTAAMDGLHELRHLDDALRLRGELAPGVRVVVIGAGFIGLEVAATARVRGCEVIVLEGLAAPLVRGLGEEMGRAVAQLHAAHGVEIRCGVTVERIEAHDGRVVAVRLAGGELVSADVVVVGIGVIPNTGWLEGSGLEIRDGVVCDSTLRAGPGVWAAGDVARWVHPLYGEEVRIEHWTNAAEQGAHAAMNAAAVLAGEQPVAYSAVPFFWSEQYGSRIQFLGRSAGADDVRVVSGSVEEGRFAAVYARHGRLHGVLGVNSPQLVMSLRTHLARRAPMGEAVAAGAEVAARSRA